MVSGMPNVEDEWFRNAEELLARLLDVHRWGYRPRKQEWAFRGHANAEWLLLPAAHRRDAFREYPGLSEALGLSKDLTAPYAIHTWKEIQLLKGFWRVANGSALLDCEIDEIGLDRWVALPADERSHGKHPLITHRQLVASAQHHQVPTRFLDWSLQPLTAAFFAAEAAAQARAMGPRQGPTNSGTAPHDVCIPDIP